MSLRAGDKSALVPGGLRMGAPALTSRGFVEKDFEQVCVVRVCTHAQPFRIHLCAHAMRAGSCLAGYDLQVVQPAFLVSTMDGDNEHLDMAVGFVPR